MRNRAFYIVMAVVALQALFFIAWAAREEMLRSGADTRIIRVRTLPFDPRDLISGRYIALRYEMGDIHRYKTGGVSGLGGYKGDTVWAVLRRDGEFYAPDSVSVSRPWSLAGDRVLIKGWARGNAIEYGVEKYFIGETEPEPSNGARITVDLRVLSDHTVRIERLNVTPAAPPVPAPGPAPLASP